MVYIQEQPAPLHLSNDRHYVQRLTQVLSDSSAGGRDKEELLRPECAKRIASLFSCLLTDYTWQCYTQSTDITVLVLYGHVSFLNQDKQFC